MLLYHLDRGHSLKEGMQINLKNGSQALSNVEFPFQQFIYRWIFILWS